MKYDSPAEGLTSSGDHRHTTTKTGVSGLESIADESNARVRLTVYERLPNSQDPRDRFSLQKAPHHLNRIVYFILRSDPACLRCDPLTRHLILHNHANLVPSNCHGRRHVPKWRKRFRNP
jgi:hypothetical protein